MFFVSSTITATWHVQNKQQHYKIKTHARIPLLLSSVSSLAVDFVDGDVLSINKQK